MANNEFPIRINIGKGEDAYEEVYNAIEKYIKPNDTISLDSYYVTLKLKSNGDIWTTNELIRYDFDIDDYIWENDWWEGEDSIEIYGLANVSTLCFRGFHKDRVIY